jgi:hypothetical protein
MRGSGKRRKGDVFLRRNSNGETRQLALQLGALREALIDAGASPTKADKAAEELAGYETRLAGIDAKLATLLALVPINIAVTVGVLWVVFGLART